LTNPDVRAGKRAKPFRIPFLSSRGISRRLLIIGIISITAYAVTVVKNSILMRSTSIGSPLYMQIMNNRFVIEDVAKLIGNLEQLQRGFNDLAAKGLTDDIEDRIASLDDFRTGVIGVIAQLKDSSFQKSSDLDALISTLESAWQEYNNAGDETTISLIIDGKVDEAKAFEAGAHATMYNNVVSPVSQLSEMLAKKVDNLENGAIRKLGENQRIDIFITIAIVFIILLVLILSARAIVNPIRTAVDVLKDIAHGEGDLTKRLIVKSNDEIGELSGYFNQFAEKLRAMISRLSETVTSLSKSSQGLTEVASHLQQTSEGSQEKVHSVAQESSNVAANIQAVSASASDMSSAVQMIAAATEQMSASLNEVMGSCRKESDIAAEALTKANATGAIVERLGTSSKEIGQVIEVIDSIAQRTNLLSLNAAIEAASAGEAGRGFTIVATEVKDLARQTSTATKNIAEKILDMQSNTQHAVAAISDISTIVNSINDISHTIVSLVTELSSTANEIARNIGDVNSSASSISATIANTAGSITSVSVSINGVSQAYGATSEGISRINSNAERLTELSSEIKEVVGHFKI